MFSRTILRTPLRKVVQVKRNMGGHSGEKPHYEGIDAVVRKYLPEDYMVSMGIIGFYSTLFLLSKIGGKKKKPAAAPVAEHKVTTTSTVEGGIPAVDSPEFGAWLSKDGNLEKLYNANFAK